MTSVTNIVGPAIVVIVPLVAAAWLPPAFTGFPQSALLCIWGVGAILVAERLLFSDTLNQALRALGFVRTRVVTLVVTLLGSLPMWAFLPLFASTNGTDADLRPDWLPLLLGVVLVNGITEEVIHRGFVFGHIRNGRPFATAAAISAMLFTAQHLYIIATMGWTIGLASVLLAAMLAYPLAFFFERGGNSIAGPAILHTSSNAPAIVLTLPEELLPMALVAHMAVVLASLYLAFIVQGFLDRVTQPSLPSSG